MRQTLEQLPVDARTPPTSVFLETGRMESITAVIGAVVAEAERLLALSFAELMGEIAEVDGTQGKQVSVERVNQREILYGIATRVDTNGKLILDTQTGSMALTSGEIHSLTIDENETFR